MSYTTNIQYKGTDICMDFNCPECSAYSHFDGFFAHHIQCPSCLTYFKMPTDVQILKVTDFDKNKECCLYADTEEAND